MVTKSMSFNEATAFFQYFLSIIGVLPNHFLDSRIPMSFFIATSLIHCSMFIGHAIFERPLALETIYETVSTLGINGRFYMLLSRRRVFAEMIENCCEIWQHCKTTDLPLVLKFERKIRKLLWFLFGSIVFINLLYSSTAIYVNHFAAGRANATKILPYHWYGVQDADNSWPSYKMVFGLQVLVIYNAGIISATVDTALPLVMMLCSGYFRILCRKLEILQLQSQNPLLADRELLLCFKFHQKILTVCSKVEKCGRMIFLVELVASGYVLSLVAVKLASSDPQKLKYTPVICLLLLHIFICQYAPEILRSESEKVSMAAFSTSCIFLDRSSGKHLLMIIRRSQETLPMTAGGVIILSLENFKKMLMSAVSFFTAMRNFTA